MSGDTHGSAPEQGGVAAAQQSGGGPAHDGAQQGSAARPGTQQSGAAAHGAVQSGAADHLVRMANDIGNFFRAEPVREDAISGIANHISKFWTKTMLRKIAAHGESGLDDLPREALRRLADHTVAQLKEYPGGDAG